MAGVEILATEQVAVEFGMNWIVGCCLGAVIALFVWFFTWLALDCDTEPFAIILSIGVGLLAGAFLGYLIGSSKEVAVPISYETHYQVTISDGVDFNEFSENYEIIDQNGKIYTVKEKN